MKIMIFKGINVLCAILFASVIIIEGLIITIGNKTEIHQEVDYLIILGAGLYWDRISPALEERLKVSLEYLEENKEIKVIVSGGQGPNEKFSEAYAMGEYLLEHGIEKERIILEDESRNTFQNLKFSLDKIKEIDNAENPRVLIASNKFHILRSKIIAKRLEMVPYGLGAEVPSTIIFKSYVREYFALIKSLLFDRV